MSSIFLFIFKEFFMDSVSRRFKDIRKALNLTQEQLAKLVHLTHVSISDIERGRTPPSMEVQMTLFSLGGRSEYLLFGEGAPIKGMAGGRPASDPAVPEGIPLKKGFEFDDSELDHSGRSNARLADMRRGMVRIPVVASVCAGTGIFEGTNVLDYIDFPIELLKGFNIDRLFCVIVDGDSMRPSFEPGDEVIASIDFPFTRGDSGKFGAVHIPDDGNMIKKIIYTLDGLELHAINPAYPVIRLDREQSNRATAYKIIRLQRSYF
jgi:transcriptional regulator with XRE-family HTH domain